MLGLVESSLFNFGIFPAVSARFFVYFCGFPDYLNILGFQISTLAIIMLALLIISAYFIFAGGQIAVMITDFIQGSFTNIVFIFIIIYIIMQVSWPQIGEAVLKAPADASLVNPFHGKNVEDFGMWYLSFDEFGGE